MRTCNNIPDDPASVNAFVYRPTRRRRTVIPDPFRSDVTRAQFFHRDIAALTDVQIWADRVAAVHELAWRRAHYRRPEIVLADADGVVDADQWLMARIRALRCEGGRRLAQRRRRV